MGRKRINARKTVVDGITFDSAGEARRYEELKELEAAGEIVGLSTQPEYQLFERIITKNGKILRPMKYTPDFHYFIGNEEVVEDYKGRKTATYQMRKKIFLHKYQHLTFIESQYKKNGITITRY